MHPYRVLVILVLIKQVSYAAPLNANHTIAPVLTHVTEKIVNKEQLKQDKNRRIRKFGFHVQIICGIDSLEDDYYGCEAVQPGLNLMEIESSAVPIINTSTTASNPSATKSKSDHVNKTCSILSSSKSWSQMENGEHTPMPKTICQTVAPKKTASQFHMTVQYDVFDESPRSKSKTHQTTRFIPKSSKIKQKQTPKIKELPSPMTPRCFEKTIDLEKLTPSAQHSKLNHQPSTSTQIIWVGNTFPSIPDQSLPIDETLR